jgi:predicted GH43/DUF377 family glycosyl hydrolase
MTKPILLVKPEDIKPSFTKWEVVGVFNPAAIRLANNKIILYARVAESGVHEHEGKKMCPFISSKGKTHNQVIGKSEVLREVEEYMFLKEGICRMTHISHLRKITLDETGTKVEKIASVPTFTGNTKEGNFGVEDPRIVKINKTYLMTYVTVSEDTGICGSLATSLDATKWDRKGIIFRKQNKNVVLFPEKINGRYVALHRPEGSLNFSDPSIWISYSQDLKYWGDDKSIIFPRKGGWDEARIGAGPPPIKTKKGWLLIHHGIRREEEKKIYCAGAILLDLKEPEKIIARSPIDKPLFSPEEDFEKAGFVNQVAFPTGMILDLNKKSVLIYSGGADRVITMRKFLIKDILNSLTYHNPRKEKLEKKNI